MSTIIQRAIGAPINRLDGPVKVTGAATYAFEYQVKQPAYLYPLQATIAAGRITGIHTDTAMAEPGVLAILTHENAPKLVLGALPELMILQSDEVVYRGQIIGGVIAETLEIARYAAGLVQVDYEVWKHDAEFRSDRNDLHTPRTTFRAIPYADKDQAAQSDIDAACSSAAVALDATYTTVADYHSPMETHATIAIWTNGELTVYASTQGASMAQSILAPLFGLDPQCVRIISPHVGGAFGSKVFPHADMVLTVMAAQRIASRPVKMALTRQQMFSQVGYRSPTIQHIRLAATAEGRLTALEHEAIELTAKIVDVADNSTRSTRMMYAIPKQRTTQLLASLNVPVPMIMRGPGETTGMFALESAIDEMAIACGIDPIEFRIRNEPDVEPISGLPFSTRYLVTCLREGARLFGWDQRNPTPRTRREGSWLVGSGVAASADPIPNKPGNFSTIRVSPEGHYLVRIAAADLGTGTWTALTQIAADALDVSLEQVELQIGDSILPQASYASSSASLGCWGTAIVDAASKLCARLASDYGGVVPAEGLEVAGESQDNPYYQQFAMYSFGVQFAEVRVHIDTGEVRVPRLLGMFDVGRIINPRTWRARPTVWTYS
jgi:xanthine dehydrogenase YagR molybdenum-binding subunit